MLILFSALSLWKILALKTKKKLGIIVTVFSKLLNFSTEKLL